MNPTNDRCHRAHDIPMDPRRKRYLIAKALWEFVAENRNKPIERQAPNDADDMEAILDIDYRAEVATLIALEPYKKR